jgi:hypothetical protein
VRLARGERSWSAVPRGLLAFLGAALIAHGVWRALGEAPSARARALPQAPRADVVAAASLNETQATALGMALYLQAFDNQPGVSIPYVNLDYANVRQWLALTLALDPLTQYPLMMASQLYGQAPDAVRQRAMCDFVHHAFLARPDARWRWLAHCAIMARHRLQDLPLALAYAQDIEQHAGKASSWARQMRIFLLADMGEVERATVLLGGLLAGNEITDPHEQHFLTERLNALRGAETSTAAPKSR